ncbi:dihydrofolate reductase family protein [Rhodococcus sp. 3Y1]
MKTPSVCSSEAVQDISIGGPTVAVSAFAAGLVDEVRLFLCPVNIGGGLRALPESRLDLQLLGRKPSTAASSICDTPFAKQSPSLP